MADVEASTPKHSRRLVGQSLLYAISVFASLGVFLVRSLCLVQCFLAHHDTSLAMTKGLSSSSLSSLASPVLTTSTES